MAQAKYNLAVTAQEPKRELNRSGALTGGDDALASGFLSPRAEAEPRSWLPWIIAFVVVTLGLVLLFVLGRGSTPGPIPGGTGMAPPASYALNLPISDLKMSEATSFAGSKVTYIDGAIANTGNKTISAVTVQVGFRNELGQWSQRAVMPLSFIRTREPYIDTEPVSAAPLRPGDHRDFRLIFDSIPSDWNQEFPEIRVILADGH